MVATYKETPVSAAEQDAIDAEQAVTDLEHKVVEGDTSITASAIEKARQAAQFARLKVQAALRQGEKDAEAARAKEAKQFLADYEEFATSDLDPLREAYEEVVLAVAHLDALVKERHTTQIGLTNHANALGPGIGGGPLVDHQRWHDVQVPENILELAYLEGKHGSPIVNAGVVAHVLHTPERRADMEAIRASGDIHGKGAELLAQFRQSIE